MDTVKKITRNSLPPIIQHNLQDLVREFRIRTSIPDKVASKCIALSKAELTEGTQSQKAVALQKLMYLHMLGYDVSWAGFYALEVMSSQVFAFKRIGYAAVSNLLANQPETLILTVNTCRKDLKGANIWVCSLALSATARFLCNRKQPETASHLAKQFFDDVRLLFNSSRPLIRQKTCLVAHQLSCSLCCSPSDDVEAEAMIQALVRALYERLDDSDFGVQTAAMSSICELVNLSKEKSRFRAVLEPSAETRSKLEKILRERQMSVPNWLLIKLVKLFCNICSDKRACGNILTPLTAFIQNTSAVSLLYECINAVIAVLLADKSGGPGAIELCAQKLSVLIEDSDQNLRYLGLQAMTHLYEGAKNEDVIQQSRKRRRELVLKCLEDQDDSIRRRAIQLLPYAVTKRSLTEVISRVMLIPHTSLVVRSIINLCSSNDYNRLSDFKWYSGVLSTLAEKASENQQAASVVADELVRVAISIPECRPHLTESIRKLLNSPDTKLRSTAAFILGQYDEDDSFLYTSDKVSPELVYALFKRFIKNENRNYERFVRRLLEITELAVGESEEIQIIERCCELCALPNNDVLWSGELPNLFRESYDIVPKPPCPPELVDMLEEKKAVERSKSNYQRDLDPVVSIKCDVFKSPVVYEDEKITCWFELKKEDHKLILHAQAKQHSLAPGVRLSIRPSTEWEAQLFISYRRARRFSSRHACLDYRVLAVSSPQKLLIDAFWKSASSQEADNHCKIQIPLAVSSFLFPCTEPNLNKSTWRELKCTDPDALSRIKESIPAFVLNGDCLLAETLMGQGVRLSREGQNKSLRIESQDKDFLVSLTDEMRMLLSQDSRVV